MKTAHIKIIVYKTTWGEKESPGKTEKKKIRESESQEKHKEEEGNTTHNG